MYGVCSVMCTCIGCLATWLLRGDEPFPLQHLFLVEWLVCVVCTCGRYCVSFAVLLDLLRGSYLVCCVEEHVVWAPSRYSHAGSLCISFRFHPWLCFLSISFVWPIFGK